MSEELIKLLADCRVEMDRQDKVIAIYKQLVDKQDELIKNLKDEKTHLIENRIKVRDAVIELKSDLQNGKLR